MKKIDISFRKCLFCSVSIALASLAGFVSWVPANAASLAYEGFDYAALSPLVTLNGGSGFSSPWGADPNVLVQSVGLASPMAKPSTGLCVGGGFNAARQLSNKLDQAEFWVSFQIQSNPGNDQVYLGLDVGPSPTPLVSFGRILNNYFIRQGGAAAVKAGVGSPVGMTDLLVARFRQFGAFSVVDLWVNTVNFASPPLISISVPPVSYTFVNLQVQPGLLADEIRIGTSPGDVSASTLGSTISGNNLTLTWDNGTLLQAPTLDGPWAPTRAQSPYTVPMTDVQQYFRVQLQ